MSIPGVLPRPAEPERPAAEAAAEFAFGTLPPAVRFAVTDIPPPGALYLGRDEVLHINAWNSASGAILVVVGKILRADGTIVPFREDIVLTADRAANTLLRELPEGYLLALVVWPDAVSVQPGQLYARALIRRGRTVGFTYQVLTMGYVDSLRFLSWPAGPAEPPGSGPGWLRSITGTDPAAGVEISETVPTGARWGLGALHTRLVADATVATRVVTLIIDDGSTRFWQVASPSGQTASQSIRYVTGPALNSQVVAQSIVVLALPNALVLAPGWRIMMLTTNLQAGDNWEAPQLFVEEWTTP